MKSKLGKALLTTVGALAVAGIAAPAYAHVDAGGGAAGFITVDRPFVAGEQAGFAATDHVFTAGHEGGWVSSHDLGGGAEGLAHIG
ncbi:hypothetical protein ACFC1R_17845 [Kitasatospora sp. NPDC056138]|uniref:hypothetical protein n=1 Tax=Kitasatospora sp. NPDC056138 TaxID=3345724 RepID=UPI0035D5D5F1